MARRQDWAASSLGSRDEWPTSLHTVVDIVLAAEVPTVVFWGDDHVMIYNDRLGHLLGASHPRAFGQPAMRGLSRSWSSIEPTLLYVHRTRAGHNTRFVIAASDHGAYVVTLELSYVPIHDGRDQVVGILALATAPPPAPQRSANDTLRTSRDELYAALGTDAEAQPTARGSSTDLRTRR